MAIIFFEGFETCGTETGLANEATTRPRVELRYPDGSFTGLLASVDSCYLVDDTFGEGYALAIGSGAGSGGNTIKYRFDSDYNTEAPGAASTTFSMGFRMLIPSSAATWVAFQQKGNLADLSYPTQLQLHVVNSADLKMYHYPAGVQTLLDTFTDAVTPGSWHFIELKWRIADTTDGIFELWVDEQQLSSNGGIDTNNFSSKAHYEISMGSVNNNDYIAYDDIYLNDGTPLGGVRVRSLPPISDSSVVWSPSTGTDNYAVVDENGADSSDYVSTTTVGAEDKYNCTERSTSRDIIGIKAEVEAVDNDSSDPDLDIIITGPASVTETVAVTDDANYAVFSTTEGGTYTAAQINTATVGMKHK